MSPRFSCTTIYIQAPIPPSMRMPYPSIFVHICCISRILCRWFSLQRVATGGVGTTTNVFGRLHQWEVFAPWSTTLVSPPVSHLILELPFAGMCHHQPFPYCTNKLLSTETAPTSTAEHGGKLLLPKMDFTLWPLSTETALHRVCCRSASNPGISQRRVAIDLSNFHSSMFAPLFTHWKDLKRSMTFCESTVFFF